MFGLGKALDEGCIDGIIFGNDPFGEAEIVDAAGVGDGEGDTGLLQRQAHEEVVRAGGFANDVTRMRELLDLSDELAMTVFGIGTLPLAALASDGEGVFGDIHSEVA
jgi:hypothetical protein